LGEFPKSCPHHDDGEQHSNNIIDLQLAVVKSKDAPFALTYHLLEQFVVIVVLVKSTLTSHRIMDTEESRKRSREADEDHWDESGKRFQGDDDTTQQPHSLVPNTGAALPVHDSADDNDNDSDIDDTEPTESVSTVEDMIAVPLDFLFRVVPQTTSAFSMSMSTSTAASQPQRHKPLLSRAEAQCLLTVALLAHELDSLVALSAKALEQRRSYGAFARKLERTNNPFLRPILFLLDVVGHHVPTNGLEKIQSELDSVTQELKTTAATLRQFSEQNWTLSESLMDSMSGTSGEIVAKEKRRLSDVQEEVCTRIERLLQATTGQSDDDLQGDLGCTMEEYCARILAPDAHNHEESHAPEASCSQQSEASGRKKEPASEEKENAPSQSSQQRQQIVLEEVYGSPNASSENTPSCRLSATQNAAEVLSSLAKKVGQGGSSGTP
jgi:hypothetical protein